VAALGLALLLGAGVASAQPGGAPPMPDHDPARLGIAGEVVPWAVLAELEVTARSVGLFKTIFEVAHPDAVRALDGRSARFMGFLFPLEAATGHRSFLLTAWPPSCPYCLPAGPTGMIEVRAAQPVPATDEPIVIEGRFELLRDDPSGLYYRLHDARQVIR
jgi:hypothetical protein